jgi:hypothetical protein
VASGDEGRFPPLRGRWVATQRGYDAPFQGTPLCPDGHLPLKGGDWAAAMPLSSLKGRDKRTAGEAKVNDDA